MTLKDRVVGVWSRDLVRNTNSQAPPQIYWVRISGDSVEFSGSELSPGFPVSLLHTGVWERCSKEWQTIQQKGPGALTNLCDRPGLHAHMCIVT